MGSLSNLNSYYWKYRRLFIPGLLCAIASSVFAIIVPGVVRQAVDVIPQMVTTYGGFADTPAAGSIRRTLGQSLLVSGALVLLLSILSGVFSFLMRQTVVVASRHIEFDLRNRLYEHIQTLSHAFYVRHSTGDLITRSTSDIEQVRRYIGPALMYSTRAIVTIVTAITAMFIISPRLTLYALVPMPFLALSVFFLARGVHRRSDAVQEQYSSLTSRVQETLSGIRVLRAYVREEDEQAAFDRESSEYRRRSLGLAFVEAAWHPVFVVIVGLSTIIVVWQGGRLVVGGTITLGNIAEYILYVALMTWPVAAFGYVISMVQRASASMARLQVIFDAKPEVADGALTETGVTRIEGSIAFERVLFRYEADRDPVLDGVSLSIGSGSTLGIVGRTGSGKSTLVEMIPRLLQPDEGRVLVDGRDVREIPLHVLREAIGYVSQDVFLFSDSIAGNIAFGRMDAPVEDIRRAAGEADLLESVEAFPDGFETVVGERGITLSGGQKQRTAIARALVREPRILILDDALSAVDTATERRILSHLRTHFGKRTIVIVSHRISAVQDADHIVVLDEGRVSEAGAHEELLEREGLYASLYRKQLLEEEFATLA